MGIVPGIPQFLKASESICGSKKYQKISATLDPTPKRIVVRQDITPPYEN
jgi:hypothetical protein